MKQKLLVLLATVLLAGAIYSWFRVDGREIEGVAEISDTCTVTVCVLEEQPTTGLGTSGYQETERFVLSAAQTEALRQLLLDSAFRRNPAKTLVWPKDETEKQYDIFIDCNDGQNVISIHAAANHHITVSNQFDDHFLMIQTDDWESRLNAILATA